MLQFLNAKNQLVMNYKITTKVENGKLVRNRKLIIDVLKSFEGKEIDITIQKHRKKRSTPQNRFYWGCIVPIWKDILKNEWGEIHTSESTHEFLKMNFGYNEKVNEETGEIFRTPRSTTENTTTEMEEYHQVLRDKAFELFGVIIPLPNEQIELI
jgi:hypothetical protein